jgi:hypothetical protein
VVQNLRRRLEEYFEAASEHPRNFLSLVRYFVHVRHQLAGAVQHLRSADEDGQERLMRQAEIAFLTRPGRFSELSGRAELIRAWTTLLVEANEKLEADERRATRYAAQAREEAEGENAVAVASRAALKRWAER